MTPDRYIAPFDSATGMANALAAFLEGRDFPLVGMVPRALEPVIAPLSAATRAVPRELRKHAWAISGRQEGVPESVVRELDAEDVAEWFVRRYPERQAEAILLGSSSGAGVHLGAALGASWLPQTFLVPVSRPLDPDDARADAAWATDPARVLLERNPTLRLHQMHDPIQDRPMLRHFAYFRLKFLRLPLAYARAIERRLLPGGTIYLLACDRTWPSATVGERHVLQHGGMGAVSATEYRDGSERIARFLEREGSEGRSWDPPPPDGESPEGEWGFDREIEADVLELAHRRGYRVRRLAYDEPEGLSGAVAELYRAWYRERGMLANRLLVESFILLDPWWTLRTGSVPYWMTFTTDTSAADLERYLDEHEPFDEIDVLLFQHGVDGVGVAPIARWRELLSRARRRSDILALDEGEHPADIATYARYRQALAGIPSRYPMPGPLTVLRTERLMPGLAATPLLADAA